jgi:hypothetical protein
MRYISQLVSRTKVLVPCKVLDLLRIVKYDFAGAYDIRSKQTGANAL